MPQGGPATEQLDPRVHKEPSAAALGLEDGPDHEEPEAAPSDQSAAADAALPAANQADQAAPSVEEPLGADETAVAPGTAKATGSARKIIFCVVIGFICAALIGVIWVATGQAIRDQRADAMARAKAWVQAQASLLTESAQRELTTIDQSLVMLEASLRADPKHFNITTWEQSLPGLSNLVKEYFIANNHYVIVQDTIPQAVGQGIGGSYATFGEGALQHIALNGKASPNTHMLLGEVNQRGAFRQYLMYLVRQIPDRPGWLVGASYRPSALVKVFSEGGLGAHGLAALIDTRHAGVQAVAGPAAVHPLLNVADTKMYKVFQNQGFTGVWIGPTGMDGVDRIHAFRRVPGRHLIAVVGLDLHDWMAPTEAWAKHARELAALASLLVVAIGGLVLWWLWALETNRRLRDALDLSNSAPGSLVGAVRNALEASTDGLALMGADGRIVAWNPSFASASGVSAEALEHGLPMGEMFHRRVVYPQARRPTLPETDGGSPSELPSDQPGDVMPSPLLQGDDSAHLIERAADRLLRSGALENSAASLLKQGGSQRGGDVAGLPPGLDAGAQNQIANAIDFVALERAGMVDWSRTRSRISEEFRLVQRQLLTTAFSGPNAQAGFSNLVVVTSARPGEGKSFMSLNLAGSISRQGDHSVLLIDADSKRDSFCYPLGLADAPGLLDLAANPRLDASHCIVKTPIERLSIMPIGRERERGPELFASKEMGRLIQTLGRRYSDRLVILDAPPCLSTSDPTLLAGVVGQVLMVVEADRTQRDEVEAAIELMEECPNVTMVLNKQRAASRFHFGAYASYYSS